MDLFTDWVIISWVIGLIGALFGIAAVFYIHRAYHNMKGGKLGRAIRKICIATVFVIFAVLNLALTSAMVVPRSEITVFASGGLSFLAGAFFFFGYRELCYLTTP